MTDRGSLAATDAPDAANTRAREQLFTLVYDELHRVAERQLRDHPRATLGPTTLLHETFLNIVQRESTPCTEREALIRYAARAMRGLVVDYLRRRGALKRGGDIARQSLPDDESQCSVQSDSTQIEKLSVALESLATIDPRLAECVELRFFGGFSFVEIARLRQVSERTVYRDWDKARVLLGELLNTSRPNQID